MAAREIVDELAAQRSKVVAVEVADPPEAWRAAGFTVDDDDCATVGEIVVLLRLPRSRADAPARGPPAPSPAIAHLCAAAPPEPLIVLALLFQPRLRCSPPEPALLLPDRAAAPAQFQLTPGSGDWEYRERGVLSLTVETDTPNAVPGSTVEINGLKWHIVEKGSSSPTPTSHPNGAIGIQKLEHNPVEAWDTLRQLVHTVLPPPRQAFKNKNPSGDDQHVACAPLPRPRPFPRCSLRIR